MLRLAIDTISETSTEYTANYFFTNKQAISTDMSESLANRLAKDIDVDIVFFQLLSIDLPDQYETAIQETEVSRQDIEKAQAERAKNNVT